MKNGLLSGRLCREPWMIIGIIGTTGFLKYHCPSGDLEKLQVKFSIKELFYICIEVASNIWLKYENQPN